MAAKQRAPFAYLGAVADHTASMDAQSRRIMKSIAQAQRAQAGIPMSSLSGDLVQAKSGTDKSDADPALVSVAPQWQGRAIEQALDRYRNALDLQLQPAIGATARP